MSRTATITCDTCGRKSDVPLCTIDKYGPNIHRGHELWFVPWIDAKHDDCKLLDFCNDTCLFDFLLEQRNKKS